MIGIHRERLLDWCNNNIDLLIVILGVAILLATSQFGYDFNSAPSIQNSGFWIILTGVVTLSVGTAAFISYRVLMRWHDFFR